MNWALRSLALILVRFFYPERVVSGPGNIPAHGPVIVVGNHPNGLIDPLILRLAVGQPVRFLGKSTFWHNPLSRTAMRAFDALPVTRAHEGDTTENDRTFQTCHEHLVAGGWLALFPEGKSHDATRMAPLKTGAARIALGAAAKGATGLRVLPVGLLYADKAVFRSAVGVAVGPPLIVPAGSADDRADVAALTDRIGDALAEVVLQAENATLWRAFLAVAAWTGAADVGARETRARQFALRWRQLLAESPEAADELARTVRHFMRVQQVLGVADPFSVEADAPVTATIAGTLPLLLLAPFAAVGAFFAWIPYRMVRPLALHLARGHNDIVGTLKLLLGFAILTPVYAFWAILAGAYGGVAVGLGVLILGPLSGWLALIFEERLSLRREALHGVALRLLVPRHAAALAARRRDLADRIATLLP